MKPHTYVYLLPLLAIGFFTTASAQEGLHIGILGLAQSTMIGGDYFVKNFQGNNFALKKEFTFGYQGGVEGGYGFTDKLGMNLGLNYSVQGQNFADYKEAAGDFSYSFKRSVQLNYLQIPIHATYISAATDDITFSAFAGFYYGILLSYADKYTQQYFQSQETLFDGTATLSGDSYKWDYSDHGVHYLETFHLTGKPYQNYDYGISAGAGIVLKLGNMVYLPAMVAYRQGLADIKNHSAAETEYSETVTYWTKISDANKSEKYSNSSLGIMVGLKFLVDELAGY